MGLKSVVPALAVGCAALPLLILAPLLATSSEASAATGSDCTVMASATDLQSTQTDTPLSAQQMSNAQVIVAVAKTLSMPKAAAAIALMTAERESGLLNLDQGDLDSLGLFQQRPSQGWGTPAQIVDPTYAATAFYTRLAAVPGWSTIPMAQAAQVVQNSGDGAAYEQWASFGTALAAALWDGATGQLVCTEPVVTPIQSGTTSTAAAVIAFAEAQLGKPYEYGTAGPGTFDCSGLVLRAYAAAGIGLPRISQEQWTSGPSVPATQLELGDLVFFNPDASGRPDHVGIYIGSGNMIDAPHTGAYVRVEPIVGFGIYMGAVRPVDGSQVAQPPQSL